MLSRLEMNAKENKGVWLYIYRKKMQAVVVVGKLFFRSALATIDIPLKKKTVLLQFIC